MADVRMAFVSPAASEQDDDDASSLTSNSSDETTPSSSSGASSTSMEEQDEVTLAHELYPKEVDRRMLREEPGGALLKKQNRSLGKSSMPISSILDASPPAKARPAGEAISVPIQATKPEEKLPEIRGARELRLVAPDVDCNAPMEADEKGIPLHYNDSAAGEGEVLRLLDQFFFCDSQGRPVSLDIMEKPEGERPLIMGFGTLVEILPAALLPSTDTIFSSKQKIIEKRDSFIKASEKLKPANHKAKQSVTESPLKKVKISFLCSEETTATPSPEREIRPTTAANVVPSHFVVDGRGPDKVVATKKAKEATPNSAVKRKRVPKKNTTPSDDSLVGLAQGYSTEVLKNLTRKEQHILESGFIYPESARRQRIYLPKIVDWCLDYSPGDPTLWVITDDAWYKIAGPSSGVTPHESYRTSFQHPRMMFEACFCVAAVLRDWLPFKKNLSYRMTLNEIVFQASLGRYPLNGEFLVEHYDFIKSQIADLDREDPTRVGSKFFSNLKRLNDFHLRKVENEKAKKAALEERQRLRDEARALRNREKEEEKRNKEEERRKNKAEAERREKERVRAARYPIEDLELLEELAQEGVSSAQRPVSKGENELMVSSSLLGDMVMIWQALITFHSYLQLSPISLETLISAVLYKEGNTVLLNEVFLALLRVIIAETTYEKTILNQDVALFGNSDRFYGLQAPEYQQMIDHLTWQEVLRQLMARDAGLDMHIGMLDPLEGCEIVRQIAYMQNNAAPFSEPLDLANLDDYTEIVKTPMDLGTIRNKLGSGGYEFDIDWDDIPDENLVSMKFDVGQKQFENDMRLVWDNAVSYNGENSALGRSANALSDLFEQEYQRLVVQPLQSSMKHLVEARSYRKSLLDPANAHKMETLLLDDFHGVVYGLYLYDFPKLPTSVKVAALSWACTEFLKLDSIRSIVEQDNRRYYELLKEKKQLDRLDDAELKDKESESAERELLHRNKLIEKGIDPDNIEDENIFAEFCSFLEEASREREKNKINYSRKKETREQEVHNEINRLSVRTQPVGWDRYFHRYWIFNNDEYGRLFVENEKTGAFDVYDKPEDYDKLLEWLNPNGQRERKLQNALRERREDLVGRMTAKRPQSPTEYLAYRNIQSIFSPEISFLTEYNDVEEIEPCQVLCFDSKSKCVKSLDVLKEFLGSLGYFLLENRYSLTFLPLSDVDIWKKQLSEATNAHLIIASLLNLERMLTENHAVILRTHWIRKRRQWLFSLRGSYTIAQLVILARQFAAEAIDHNAVVDLIVDLERRAWIDLCPKECRAYIPNVGQKVVYFGEGHEQALREDAKARHFIWNGDDAVLGSYQCVVASISYHRGGGDPYARVVLSRSETDRNITRPLGFVLCKSESPAQSLNRLFYQIILKMMNDKDGEPFSQPVSKKEFPEYYQLITDPMDLSVMLDKARSAKYLSVDAVLEDVNQLVNNCVLFCEDRFPTLPPMAFRMRDIFRVQVRRFIPQIKRFAKEIAEGLGTENTITEAASIDTDLKRVSIENTEDCKSSWSTISVTVRLRNRLPEFLVDLTRYEQSLLRVYEPGHDVRVLYQNADGSPSEHYEGTIVASTPSDATHSGLIPWESLTIASKKTVNVREEFSQVNPWEVELVNNDNKSPVDSATTKKGRRRKSR